MSPHERPAPNASMGADDDRANVRSLLVDFARGRLSPEESLRVLDAVSQDPDLSQDLDLVILMLREGEAERRRERGPYRPGRETGPAIRETSGALTVVLRSAAVLFILCGGLLVFDVATTPPYARRAAVVPDELHLRIRDAGTDVLATSRMQLSAGNWEEARRLSEWYLNAYPHGDRLADACVLKAAADLMGARQSVLGFHIRYDAIRIESALQSLDRARALVPGERYADMIDWLEAKAFLMQGDRQRAIHALEQVVRTGGEWAPDAHRLLQDVQ